jgi:hypothetical protein
VNYRGEKAIIGKKSRLYHGEKITFTKTEGGHYYIDYKGHELDIGGHTLENGLLAALEWFGNIIQKEAVNEK